MRTATRKLLLFPLGVALVGCQGQACNALAPCPSASSRSGCPQPVDQAFVDPFVHLGRAESDTFIEITDLVADYPFVYACTGTQGLTVWDVSNESEPALRAQQVGPPGLAHARFPRCQHVGLDRPNQRLVITNRGDEIQPTSWLALYDVSAPADPSLERTWPSAASIEGVYLDGNTLYAAGHVDGVFVLEDRGGTAFTILGNAVDDGSDAWQPLMVGDHLLVAEGATGLRVYETSADVPVLVGTVALEGSARDLVVRDGLAYVATSAGIAIVDVADPTSPILVSETATPGTTLAIALGADQSVVTAEWDEVRGYAVGDPHNVTQLFAEAVPTTSAFARILAVDADPERGRAYAGEWEGMHVYQQLSGGLGPDIWATPQAVQFGNVSRGDAEDRVVVIRNAGNQPLTVHDVITEPNIDPDSTCFQVPEQGSAAVEVRYDPESSNQFISAIKFCSDDPDEGEYLVQASANVKGLDVGDEMPHFVLNDLIGLTHDSDNLRGRVVVLAYFATF